MNQNPPAPGTRDPGTTDRLQVLARYRALQKSFELKRNAVVARERLLMLRQSEQVWHWLAL